MWCITKIVELFRNVVINIGKIDPRSDEIDFETSFGKRNGSEDSPGCKRLPLSKTGQKRKKKSEAQEKVIF